MKNLNVNLLETKCAMIAHLIKEVSLEIGTDWHNLSDLIGMSSSHVADMFSEIDWRSYQANKLQGCYLYDSSIYTDHIEAFKAGELKCLDGGIGEVRSIETADTVLTVTSDVLKLTHMDSFVPVFINRGEVLGLDEVIEKISEK